MCVDSISNPISDCEDKFSRMQNAFRARYLRETTDAIVSLVHKSRWNIGYCKRKRQSYQIHQTMLSSYSSVILVGSFNEEDIIYLDNKEPAITRLQPFISVKASLNFLLSIILGGVKTSTSIVIRWVTKRIPCRLHHRRFRLKFSSDRTMTIRHGYSLRTTRGRNWMYTSWWFKWRIWRIRESHWLGISPVPVNTNGRDCPSILLFGTTRHFWCHPVKERGENADILEVQWYPHGYSAQIYRCLR